MRVYWCCFPCTCKSVLLEIPDGPRRPQPLFRSWSSAQRLPCWVTMRRPEREPAAHRTISARETAAHSSSAAPWRRGEPPVGAGCRGAWRKSTMEMKALCTSSPRGCSRAEFRGCASTARSVSSVPLEGRRAGRADGAVSSSAISPKRSFNPRVARRKRSCASTAFPLFQACRQSSSCSPRAKTQIWRPFPSPPLASRRSCAKGRELVILSNRRSEFWS